jgi:hypothetical protein
MHLLNRYPFCFESSCSSSSLVLALPLLLWLRGGDGRRPPPRLRADRVQSGHWLPDAGFHAPSTSHLPALSQPTRGHAALVVVVAVGRRLLGLLFTDWALGLRGFFFCFISCLLVVRCSIWLLLPPIQVLLSLFSYSDPPDASQSAYSWITGGVWARRPPTPVSLLCVCTPPRDLSTYSTLYVLRVYSLSVCVFVCVCVFNFTWDENEIIQQSATSCVKINSLLHIQQTSSCTS